MIILDFDGVLFDSAWEAYEVGHLTVFGVRHGPADLSRWDLFRALRWKILAAWQYKPVFDSIRFGETLSQAEIRLENSRNSGFSAEDKEFESMFFECRKAWIERSREEWQRLSRPMPFFFAIRPLIEKHPEHFAIVSTRNEESIREMLQRFIHIDRLKIFGSAEFQANEESKAATIRKLVNPETISLFVDDGEDHLLATEGIPGLHTFLAGWGYVPAAKARDNSPQVTQTIIDLLKEI